MRITSRIIVSAAAVALAVVTASGCVRPHGPEDLRRDLSYAAGVRLHREVGITVTRSGIWLARMGLNIAGENTVPLRGLRRVEVGVYTVEGLRRGHTAMATPSLPELDDWTPLVRVHDGDDTAIVLVEERGDRIRRMVVLAADGEEWVIVRLRGKLDRMVEDAMRFAFEEARRPDLYERSRQERGLDPDEAEQATFESSELAPEPEAARTGLSRSR